MLSTLCLINKENQYLAQRIEITHQQAQSLKKSLYGAILGHLGASTEGIVMAKNQKKQTQIQVLETWRGELEMSIPNFSVAIGITRQWYYECLKEKKDVLDKQTLDFLAVDHIGEWQGALAIECIRLIDERLIPCVCQTAVGDAGLCPKHTKPAVVVSEPVLEVEAAA